MEYGQGEFGEHLIEVGVNAAGDGQGCNSDGLWDSKSSESEQAYSLEVVKLIVHKVTFWDYELIKKW